MYVVDVLSVFPITTEPVVGVMDVTAVAPWLDAELPVAARRPVAVTTR